MIDYTGGSPMGQPGQGNPYNTGMAGPRPGNYSPGGFGGMMPGAGNMGGQVDPSFNIGGPQPDIMALLKQLGIDPNSDPFGQRGTRMGMGQANRGNLSQFAMRAPNQGGMGTGQSPPSSMGTPRMGNMGGGFGLGPPMPPAGMGNTQGSGPLASTGMGMQRPSNPMPSIMPSGGYRPPPLSPAANYDPSKPVTPMAGNQNTGITGGMNRSYSPSGGSNMWLPPAVRAGANGTEQFTNGGWNPYTTAANTPPQPTQRPSMPTMRSGNTGGGGSFGMGG